MNKLTANILYIVLILAVITGVYYMIWFIQSEGKMCLANPYIYGASKMKDVSCQCQQTRAVCPALFNFNDTSFIPKINDCGTSVRYDTSDFSKINFTLK